VNWLGTAEMRVHERVGPYSNARGKCLFKPSVAHHSWDIMEMMGRIYPEKGC
jgi:hypothetical protein